MRLLQILQNPGLSLLTQPFSGDPDVTLGCCSDVLSDVMARAEKGSLWITHQTNENVLAIAFFKELAGVVFPDRLQPTPDIIAKANEKKIVLLSSTEPAFQIAGLLYAQGLRGKK